MRLGVYAAPLTPFTGSGEINHDLIPPYVTYLLRHRINGLLVLGTNGEFASLTTRERREVLESFRRHTPDEIPIIVNVGATNLADILELTRHAREAGAQNVALLPPYYFPLTDQGYLRIARRTAEVFGQSIYLYNIPRYTGYTISPGVVETLAAEGVARGLKDSSQDMEYLRAVRERVPNLEVFIGSDTTLVEGLELGAQGVVSGMANTYPDLIVSTYEAFHGGKGALPALRQRVLYIRKVLANYPYLAGTRQGLAMRGIDPGPPRLPLIPLSPDQAARLTEELAAYRQPIDAGSAA